MASSVVATKSPGAGAGAGGREWAARLLSWLRPAWPALLVGLAFVPMLVLHARELWSRPHYQFLPVLIPAAVVLAWRDLRGLGPVPPGWGRLASGLGGAAWLLLALGIALVSPTLATVTALFTTMAAAYTLGGSRLARAVAPTVMVLALGVPLPKSYDARLLAGLQDRVSDWSGNLLDVLRVEHAMEGHVVEIAGRRLLVDEACSGINSLFTLTAATVFFLLWVRAPWPRWLAMLPAAVFWVLTGNVLRIVTIAAVAQRLGIDLSVGKKHELLGIVVFFGMLAMMWSTWRLLGAFRSFGKILRSIVYGTRRQVRKASWAKLLFKPHQVASRKWNRQRARQRRQRRGHNDPSADAPQVETAPRAPTVAAKALEPAGDTPWANLPGTWLGRRAAGLAFAALLLPQAMLPGFEWKDVLVNHAVYAKAFATLGDSSAPQQSAGYQRLSFRTEQRPSDDRWGEFSRTWTYVDPAGTLAILSLDYPFVGFHDLSLCYSGQGWQVVGRKVETDASGEAVVSLDLAHPEGQFGQVVFGVFDRRGRGLEPPERRGLAGIAWDRLSAWAPGATLAPGSSSMTHQLQVFVESVAPLTPDEHARVRSLYDQARTGFLRDALTKAGEVKP